MKLRTDIGRLKDFFKSPEFAFLRRHLLDAERTALQNQQNCDPFASPGALAKLMGDARTYRHIASESFERELLDAATKALNAKET